MLYDIFKHWGTDIWIYSDPHFGDLDSYKLRFPQYFKGVVVSELSLCIRCMDEMQIKNINAKCGKKSTLIILGDVGNIECVKKLKAKYKILIMGNHDKGASNYKRVKYTKDFIYSFESWYEFVNRVKAENDSLVEFRGASEKGEDVYTAYYDNHLFDEVYEGPLMINDRLILSHEPIRSIDDYFFNIHGHSHSLPYVYDSHHLNIVAENLNYIPVNLLSLLKKGLLSKVKNIHRDYIDTRSSH